MRIEQLDLERYGRFENRSLSFEPQASLHLVFGANEAGKTSALSAIGDLLFGFGGRTDYDFRHEAKALRVGGRLRHSDGRIISARRRKGNKNTLVDENERPLPEDLFAPLLGGMSRETFEREFGLTAAGLRAGGLQLLEAGGRLTETLAASSAGMTALSRIRQKLQTEADGLFTPRKSGSKAFYIATERRENADKVLRDAIVTRDAIRQAEDKVKTARDRLDALTAEHAELGSKLACWQRVLRVRSPLARLDSIDEELRQYSNLPPVSAQTLSDWQSSFGDHAAVQNQIEALDEADKADAAEVSKLAVDEQLLSTGSEIDQLRERVGAVRKAADDLPRRRQARDHAQGVLDGLARRLGMSNHVALLQRLPTDMALGLVRELIGKVRWTEREIADAESRRNRAQQEFDALSSDDAAVDVVDIEQLQRSFEAIGDIPAIAEQCRRAVSAFKVETQALSSEVASFRPSPGALEQLAAVPLPDIPVIAKHAHAFDAVMVQIRQFESAIALAEANIASIEAELVRLSGAGKAPTREDLVQARRGRDVHIEGLRAVLDGDREQRSRLFEDVRFASQAIDNVTDLLLSDMERAARQEDAQSRLAASREEHGPLAAKLAELQADAAEFSKAWERLWEPAGLVPSSPADMLRWRERLDGVLSRLRERDKRQVEIDTLTERLEAGNQAVLAFLKAAGRNADANLAADILFREAKDRLGGLQKLWTESKVRAETKRRVERDLKEAGAAKESSLAALANLRERWPVAMAGIGLSAEATAAEADAALAVWSEVPTEEVTLKRERRSVEGIETDLQSFGHDVGAIAERVAPHLSCISAQDSLTQLQSLLSQARGNSEARQQLRNQMARRVASREILVAKCEAIKSALNEACRPFGVADIAGLADLLQRLTEYHGLRAEQAKLRQSLSEIGDGLDECALRQERESLDLDQLGGAIERHELRQRQVLKDIEAASAVHHQEQTAFEALMRGRNVAAAAAERADASAELLEIAESWLLRAAASRLATRTIERYRARVQDPLIARVGTLFATATRNGFAGLGVEYGDDDQPSLVAQRVDGERVPISGLSEGTRDQLFISLRLAVLEQWPSEPMPFIGDDLLASFDDARAQSMLELLAAAGEQKQIILFTHHHHVVDLANSMSKSAIDIVEL